MSVKSEDYSTPLLPHYAEDAEKQEMSQKQVGRYDWLLIAIWCPIIGGAHTYIVGVFASRYGLEGYCPLAFGYLIFFVFYHLTNR